MQKRLIPAMLLLLAPLGCAHAPSAANDPQALIALEEKRLEALTAEDHATLDGYHHEEFARVLPDGTVHDRAETVEEMRSRTVDYVKVERTYDPVRFVDDDVAIVSGTSMMQSSRASGPHRFTHVWVRQNGAWKLVSAHYSAAE